MPGPRGGWVQEHRGVEKLSFVQVSAASALSSVHPKPESIHHVSAFPGGAEPCTVLFFEPRTGPNTSYGRVGSSRRSLSIFRPIWQKKEGSVVQGDSSSVGKTPIWGRVHGEALISDSPFTYEEWSFFYAKWSIDDHISGERAMGRLGLKFHGTFSDTEFGAIT